MNYRNRQKPSYSLMLALEPRMVFDGAIAVPDTAAIAADVTHVTGNVLSDGTAHDTGTGSLAVQGVAGSNPTAPLNTGVNTVIAGTYGSLDIQANGRYDYSLNTSAANVMALGAGQPATDTFSYTMTDEIHNTSITTLTVDITGVNDARTAVADSTHITASAANVTGDLLTNDTDSHTNDSKTVSAISTSNNTAGIVGSALTSTYGSLTVNADGSYSYALDNNNAGTQALPVGQTLTDTFNYTMKDSGNLSSSSTLTITIDGSNTANTVGSYSVVRDVTKANEVVFLDGALPNLNLLESSVPSGIEIVVLDPTGNEVQQITNFLAEHTGYSAVNIVSHGDSGELFLGQSVLSDATLAQYSQQLEFWKNSLAPGADLLIYGSDVVSGTIGQNFITELARLTGTTVAASTDITGSANYGGNWILEAQTGVLDVKTIDFGTTGWDGEMTSAVTDTVKPKSSEITFVNNQLGTSTDTVSTLVTAQTKAAELIAQFLQRPDALEQLFNLFNGQQATASKQWLDTTRNLLQDVLDGNYLISVKTISNEQIGGVFGAFAANGPSGQPIIFMNQDWLARNPTTETISRVLIEELGHSLDHALNGNIDTAGDEGEAFAAKVLNFDLSAVDWQRIASEDDHSTIYLDGQAYEVEDAAITFTKVYQGTPSSWSQEAQNITTYATAVSGSNFKFVSTDPNAAYFSGNNVSGDLVYKDANGNTISISGVVSRLIKTGSTVEGLFFYATGPDGLINGIGDTSYIFAMDPTKFTGSTQYGTSSDPVDTALNSFIVPNSAPVVNNDSATVTEDSLVTGNVLANDTDANADSLTVSAFTISGQAGPFTVGIAYVISGVGSLTINSNGSYTFTPTANYSGVVPAVTYTASDGKGGTATANLSLTITPVNDPPTSTNDSINVYANTKTLLTLNDFGTYNDVDGDALSKIKITTLPSTGTLEYYNGSTWVSASANQEFTVADISAGKLRYTGTASESLQFKVSDGTVYSDSAYTLTLTVIANTNVAPDAVNDSNFVYYTTSHSITGYVLPNDNDPDGSNASLVVSRASTGATLAGTIYTISAGTPFAANNETATYSSFSVTFSPSNKPSNGDTVTLSGTGVPAGTTGVATMNTSDTGTIVLNNSAGLKLLSNNTTNITLSWTGIAANKTAPTLSATVGTINTSVISVTNTTASLSVGMTVSGTGISPGTTISSISVDPTDAGTRLVKLSNAYTGTLATDLQFTPAAGATITGTYGTLVIQSNGSYTYTATSSVDGSVDTFTYELKDPNGGTDTATLKITIINGNVAPVNTIADKTATYGTPLTFSSGLSVSDANTNVTSTTLTLGYGTLNATATGSGSVSTNGTSSITLSGTQAEINTMLASLTYSSASGFDSGTDTLRMVSTDAVGLSDTDTVNITVNTPAVTVTGTTVNEASAYLMFSVTGVVGQKVTLALGTTGTGAGYATIGDDILPGLMKISHYLQIYY